MKRAFLVYAILLAIAISMMAQPSQAPSFNHRLEAMGATQSVIDGDGYAVDIYDISGGTNPSASHFNQGHAVPPEWQLWTGGANKFAFDVSFKTLKYPGPTDDGEVQNWYWVDGVSRILVDMGFESGFSMRIKFNGGYQTMRKSWLSGFFGNEYTAATLDWGDIASRAATSGASSLTPLGEFYLAYHTPFGFSVGAGGGYGFSEANHWSYPRSHTTKKNTVNSYRANFGARYTYPDFDEYFAVGLNFGISGGKVNNETDDYTSYDNSDNLFGIQAEFGYPEFVRGAFGWRTKTMNEESYPFATATDPNETTDKLSGIDLKMRLMGEGVNVPITLGLDLSNWSTDGDDGTNELIHTNSTTAFGISAEPVKDILTFSAQMETGKIEYDTTTLDTRASVEMRRISLGTEVYPSREFGIRMGFEILERTPDDDYSSMLPWVLPYLGPITRFNYVPELEKANAITGGFVLRLDDDRLLVELSAKHYFTSKPEVYRSNSGSREEAYFGFTYYLK
ncbi:MAG TPA: hypothetical protein ENN07_04340 [candidate division Zixibacteria bacterium]|nr:hypothetical protein [candidate division Zixibacteria bacterium]